MTNPSAACADNGVCDVVLVLALPGLVVRGSAVCAARSVSLPQCSIKEGQLSKLVAAEIVLTLRDLDSLLDNFHDLLHGALNGRRVDSSHIGMKWFILPRKRLSILPSDLSFFDAALSPDYDPCPCFLLHGLERVSSRTNQQPYEIDIRMLVLRNHHLVRHLNLWCFVIRRWFILKIDLHHPLNGCMPVFLEFFPLPVVPSIQPLPVARVDRLRTRGPILWINGYA